MRIFELFEAFTSTPHMELNGSRADAYSPGYYYTRFSTGGKTYLMDFAQAAELDVFGREVWCVSFRQRDTAGYRPTGNVGQDATTVMGSVVHAVRTFIAEHHPVAIGFTGKRTDRLGRLYVNMVKRLGQEISDMGYETHSEAVDVSGVQDAVLLYREGTPAGFMARANPQTSA